MTQAHPLPARRMFNWQLKKSTFSRARDQLSDALRLLGATNPVLSTNLELRLDGQPYAADANKRIDDPGVAVYFQLRGKPMSMARDAFDNPTHNLRSLAMAIDHLRGLERHGGASMMERAFAGFTALPPPTGQQEEPAIEWRKELSLDGYDLSTEDMLALAESRYRSKAKSVHSDQKGGDDTAMIRLNAAIAQARAELKT